MRIFRVLIRVPDIESATSFYAHVLGAEGQRVSPGRHVFGLGAVELMCYDPRADGDLHDVEESRSLWQLYVAVDDLAATERRVGESTGSLWQPITVQPWGERVFYAADPFGNRLCFVDSSTVSKGLHHP